MKERKNEKDEFLSKESACKSETNEEKKS